MRAVVVDPLGAFGRHLKVKTQIVPLGPQRVVVVEKNEWRSNVGGTNEGSSRLDEMTETNGDALGHIEVSTTCSASGLHLFDDTKAIAYRYGSSEWLRSGKAETCEMLLDLANLDETIHGHAPPNDLYDNVEARIQQTESRNDPHTRFVEERFGRRSEFVSDERFDRKRDLMTVGRTQQMAFKKPRTCPALIDEFREIGHVLRVPVGPNVELVLPGGDVFEFAFIDLFPLSNESVQCRLSFVNTPFFNMSAVTAGDECPEATEMRD